MTCPAFDPAQSAAAEQFQRQSDRYGRSHILADTSDVAEALRSVTPPPDGAALDVATGGGHTALWLARQGWRVTAGDIAPRMLENAQRLLGEEGLQLTVGLFPAENLPFPAASFDLVASRVAPHHFSSPRRFVEEAARVLRPDGWLLIIDGSVPDDDPATAEWLHRVETWRDPSHGRFLARREWEDLVASAGFSLVQAYLRPMKQPDLNWYFDTAATPIANRERVLEAVRAAPAEVRSALQLTEEQGRISWFWPRLTLLARRND